MTDQMLEEQNMMNPEKSPKPRLQCYRDMDRTCGPDCVAYLTSPPTGRDYVEKDWARCHLLVTEHQKAKHLVILANVASREPAAGANLPAPPVVR